MEYCQTFLNSLWRDVGSFSNKKMITNYLVDEGDGDLLCSLFLCFFYKGSVMLKNSQLVRLEKALGFMLLFIKPLS